MSVCLLRNERGSAVNTFDATFLSCSGLSVFQTELGALFFYKRLPLNEQTIVNVGEKERHKSILFLAWILKSETVLLVSSSLSPVEVVCLELVDAGKVLLDNDGS